jgi:fructose-1,6-bisphosphatase/inositol monophosphatase family enzyme
MHLKPYDILALVPIIEGSGGTIRTLNNHAVTMQDYANVIACGSPELMQKAFKQLQA